MQPLFTALSENIVRDLQADGLDANGQRPERRVSDGADMPCRHCLRNIDAGEEMLIVAHRPFETVNPYAETGPIFLHARACARAEDSADIPAILTSGTYIVRGYSADARIVYGTGGVVPTPDIPDVATALLSRDDVVHVDVRSAANNCFQCRIVPG